MARAATTSSPFLKLHSTGHESTGYFGTLGAMEESNPQRPSRLQQMQPWLDDLMAFHIVIDAGASNRHAPCEGVIGGEQQVEFCNLVTINSLMKGYMQQVT